MYFAS
jgi:hypothetical protein